MGFDENPPSPDLLVNTRKRTTKVNICMAAAVFLFFLIGALAIWLVAQNPP